jgi:hypothetical protein
MPHMENGVHPPYRQIAPKSQGLQGQDSQHGFYALATGCLPGVLKGGTFEKRGDQSRVHPLDLGLQIFWTVHWDFLNFIPRA